MDEKAPVRVAPRPTMMLVGRIALGAIFLLSGIAKLADQQGTLQHMEQAGIPAPHLMLFIAAFAEIFGAAALMTGFLARLGALGLVVYLAITTLVFHHFWTMEGDEAKTQMVNFMKNLSIIGGLLVLSAAGAQNYSIDARRRRPVEP